MIYTLPFIAALIGWFTNFIAVKMLFHPKKAINLFGIKIQGIFPKRQHALAEQLGIIVSRELFSIDDLLSQVKNSNNSNVLGLVEKKLDDFILVKLPSSMPMLSMFLNDDLKNKIKQTLLAEIEIMLPEIIDSFAKELGNNIDIKGTVQSKVARFSTDKLEDILYSIMKKEFRFIEILGAILGFIIGIIQVLLLRF